MAKSQSAEVVFNAFIPDSPDLVAACAEFDKAEAALVKARAKVADIAFAKAKAKGAVDDSVRAAFNVSKRWQQWSWFVRTASAKSAKSKGVAL